MATLIVLLLISITLALSYSIMRTQSTASAIQRNANLGLQARLAAMAGINAGLKRMHVWDENDASRRWSGVGTTLSGQLSSAMRFEVRYATGDPSLVVNDPWLEQETPTLIADHKDRADFPYRVTLFATGIAIDPSDPARETRHRIRAVVRLVPRKLADEPSVWEDVCKNTVYQWTPGDYDVGVPFRIEGPQRIQGQLRLGADYPWSSSLLIGSARRRYLCDLHAMTAAAETTDFRPFNGRLWFWRILQESGLVSNVLNTPTVTPTDNVILNPKSMPSLPREMTGYRIYPGGKRYSVKPIARNLTGDLLGPDPIDNPLGIFLRNGDVCLGDDVTIRGTLLARGTASGDVVFSGRNVRLLSLDLPPLAETDAPPIRLPVVVAEDDVRFEGGTQAIVTGMIVSSDDFEIKPSDHDALALSGTAIIEDGELTGNGNFCHLRAVHLNRTDAKQIPIGAQFRLSDTDNPTLYTVTRRTPEEGSPTVSVEFSPSWGEEVPREGDEIYFVPSIAGATVVTIRGRVAAKNVLIAGYSNWVNSTKWWSDRYNEFIDQLGGNASTRIDCFPVWLQATQHLTPWSPSAIKQEAVEDGQVRYHWSNSYDPIYAPHPDDGGLRWELLEWTDNP